MGLPSDQLDHPLFITNMLLFALFMYKYVHWVLSILQCSHLPFSVWYTQLLCFYIQCIHYTPNNITNMIFFALLVYKCVQWVLDVYTPCALQPASGYILSGCTAPGAVRFSILHNSMKYCSAWLQFGECICFFNFEWSRVTVTVTEVSCAAKLKRCGAVAMKWF